MTAAEEATRRLCEIPHVTVTPGVWLAERTRFGIGGLADLYVETPERESFVQALEAVRSQGLRWSVIGGGTNLVASDEGFRGVILRYTGAAVLSCENGLRVEAGAELQQVVDFANARGLAGLETLAGIPGTVGGAIYGNAGAYGRSIAGVVSAVWCFRGAGIERLQVGDCGFEYRESAFKQNKGWVIISAELRLASGDAEQLRLTSACLIQLRNRKYPPEMKCAGSIFKNLAYDRLPPAARRAIPPELVREGKAPAAWFLEQVGAKGLRRGGVEVAAHHANLIYNTGGGTARQLRELIAELKRRVHERFALELEEEVQHLG